MSRYFGLALRIFLPCYFLVYIVVGWVLAVARVRRRYGVDPLEVRSPDPISSLGESYRNVLFALALVIVLVNAVDPGLLAWLGPIPVLEAPLVQGSGVVLLVASLILLRAAQIQMKGSWRVGCDRGGSGTELITTGLFAKSRNPIYIGLILTAAGLFLALPNAVTFAMANLTVLLLQVRVRLEEQYLMESHGEAFAEYCRRTPRWLLRAGRDG